MVNCFKFLPIWFSHILWAREKDGSCQWISFTLSTPCLFLLFFFSHLQLADTIEEAARAAEDASQEALALLQAFVSGESIGTTSVQGIQKK